MNNNYQRPPPYVVALAGIASILALAGSAGLLYYMGIFSKPVLSKQYLPQYRIAYLPHSGTYRNIEGTINKVTEILTNANINPGPAVALMFDDPSVVEEENLRSKVGHLVNNSDYIPGELGIEEIAPREALVAVYDGNPALGSYKSYSAMKEWSKNYRYKLELPALEIYYKDKGTVEYQLNISRLP